MGACSSCLGLGRRDSHDAESTRLLDDDLYQTGYSYGGVNQGQRNGPDPEDVKREREALEAICQRTSDSVVDVWSSQQPYLSARRPPMSFSSRMPSAENGVTPSQAGSSSRNDTTSPQPSGPDRRNNIPPTSPTHGEFGTMKYVAYPNVQILANSNPATMPKHWGEVVMSSRKGKKPRPALDMSNADTNSDDLFGVLRVQ